jgi:hypothetical protein
MHRRAYFHARSCVFVLYLFVEPFVTASLFEIRKVAESRRH